MESRDDVITELKSTWTTVEGCAVHAYVAGSERDRTHGSPSLVLVSGLGVSARYFLPTLRLLARHFHVAAPELPGSGKSAKPPHPLDFAELALQRPERIERLVFLGPTVDPRWRTLVRQVPRWLLEAAREPLSLLPILIRDYFTFGPRRFLRAGRTALEDRLETKLPQIRADTLVVRGERDAFVSAPWAETVARLLPRGSYATIRGAAHAANYSAPALLADLVRPFLLGHGSGPAIERPPDALPEAGTSRTPEAWRAGTARPIPAPAAAPTSTSVGK